VREQREFRARYAEFQQAGLEVAGISLDTIERSLAWSRRLKLPYALLSDADRVAGAEFGVVRRLGIGAWGVEWFRRSTMLADRDGIVRAVWETVPKLGHAAEVLAVAKSLRAMAAIPPGDFSPPTAR
jgi:peroxiredoxin Q/BCP